MALMILLLGGAGFLGSAVARRLTRMGLAYRVVDNFRRGRTTNLEKPVECVPFDIRCAPLPATLFTDVTVIVFLVTLWLAQCEEDPWDGIATNIGGLRNTLAALPRTVQRIVYVSSASVYGDPAIRPTPEACPRFPTTVYGWTKAYGEDMVLAAGRTPWEQTESSRPLVFRPSVIILRPFNLYGPGQDTYSTYTQVLPIWAEQCLHGEPLTVYGDGSDTLDFVYVEDAADAILRACDPAIPDGIYNLCSGREMSVHECAIRVGQTLTGCSPRLHYAPRHRDVAGRAHHRCGDPTHTAQTLGWQTTTPVALGLRNFCDWWTHQHLEGDQAR